MLFFSSGILDILKLSNNSKSGVYVYSFLDFVPHLQFFKYMCKLFIRLCLCTFTQEIQNKACFISIKVKMFVVFQYVVFVAEFFICYVNNFLISIFEEKNQIMNIFISQVFFLSCE